MEFAFMSKCKIKCGATLIDKYFRIISYGYNGETSGFSNLKDDETVVHSEQNTLLWTSRDLKSIDILYYICNRMPCNKCTSLILNYNIKGLIFFIPLIYDKTFQMLTIKEIPFAFVTNDEIKNFCSLQDELLFSKIKENENILLMVNRSSHDKYFLIKEICSSIEKKRKKG
jgi:deoxycytidylate deaminase